MSEKAAIKTLLEISQKENWMVGKDCESEVNAWVVREKERKEHQGCEVKGIEQEEKRGRAETAFRKPPRTVRGHGKEEVKKDIGERDKVKCVLLNNACLLPLKSVTPGNYLRPLRVSRSRSKSWKSESGKVRRSSEELREISKENYLTIKYL